MKYTTKFLGGFVTLEEKDIESFVYMSKDESKRLALYWVKLLLFLFFIIFMICIFPRLI